MTWMNRDYTDVFVFVGLTQREAEEDYRAFRRARPETFLGYSVKVIGVQDCRAVEGLRVHGYLIQPRAWRSVEHAFEMSSRLSMSVLMTNPPTK